MRYKYTVIHNEKIIDFGTATTHHNAQSKEDDIFIEDVMFQAYDNGHKIKVESIGESDD